MHVHRELDDITFHKLSNETLDELTDFFEDLGDSGLIAKDYDITLAVSKVTFLLCNWSVSCLHVPHNLVFAGWGIDS